MSSENSFNLNTSYEQKNSTSKLKRVYYAFPRKLRIVGSIVMLTALIVFLLEAFKPEARKRAIPETVVKVETITAELANYPIVVSANGTVEAETRGDLVAQIRGEIVAVSDNFKTGGSFKKGDLLIQLDQRDYQAELSGALANLSQAEAAYRQEQATAKQAKIDWQRLGNTAPAPELVLRKPQLTAAKAQYDSAKAAHDTAELNLSRTAITAPYDGRIIERRAVLGQYVSIGSPIAEVFATQGVEVRLPISQEEFSQLGLDNFSNEQAAKSQFIVSITSSIGNQTYQWDANIARTDSTFDLNTRQIDVIATVQDPFSRQNGKPALKIGQFVNARIQGRSVDNVFVIPNRSVREGSYVYVVRDGKLAKQSITIAWQDDQNALITSGVQPQELVVTTSLNSTLAGARAKLADTDEANSKEPAAAPNSEDSQVTDTAGSLNTESESADAKRQDSSDADAAKVESANQKIDGKTTIELDQMTEQNTANGSTENALESVIESSAQELTIDEEALENKAGDLEELAPSPEPAGGSAAVSSPSQ